MVWTADQMMDSYGNAMPTSYYEQGRMEYTQFVSWCVDLENRWGQELGVEVTVDVAEYVSQEQVRLFVWLGTMRLGPFASLTEIDEYLDRMYP